MRILLTALACLSLHSVALANNSTFTLTTDAFAVNGPIPTLYTCDGADQSPMLHWSNAPAGTKRFAIVMKDLGATNGTFYHWAVVNIPANVTTLAANMHKAPADAKMGVNGFKHESYNGPCPPKYAKHTYIFTVYALSAPVRIQDHTSDQDIETALDTHILGTAELKGIYSRWQQ